MHIIERGRLVARTERGLRLSSQYGDIEVTLRSEGMVRVRLAQDDGRAPVRYVEDRASSDFAARIGTGDDPSISTGSLSVGVALQPFRLQFGRPGEPPHLTEVLIALDAGGSAEESTPPPSAGRQDGATATATAPTGDRRRPGRFEVRMRLPREHHFYGLGHGGKQLDRTGALRQIWNSHIVHGTGSDFAVPLLISNRGYGLFFDNTYDARMSVGRTDNETEIVFAAEGGPIDFYYFAANDVRGLLGAAADLLGRAPLPPLWFFGFLQSTRHFDDTGELRSLARSLRERRIPCDGLIFLSTYHEALGWNRQVGHLEFEPTLWSDPRALIEEMKAQQFEVVTHEYPVLHPDSPLFPYAREKGFLLSGGYPSRPGSLKGRTDYHDEQHYIDFSSAECRSWWWEQHRELVEYGVAGWWLDGGEGPSADSVLHEGSGQALHNVYDRLRFQAFADGEARDRPDLRVVSICRSGSAGMQQFGASCWSGDINNTFATLAAQIPIGLNTGLSGIPYWGTDIGGFFHPTAETGELFARWFQFGAFCPLFRAHGYVWREHLPWAHGEEIERICREYAELRYRLLPYTYSLAWQAYLTGLPLMRPLVLNYPDDPRVWDLGDEYLWGDDLLVAPVVQEGARRRAVYLPRGIWYDYWTWTRHEGGQGVEVDAPLDRLPLFVREGAAIPMVAPVQHTADGLPPEVTVLAIPGSDSHFDLFDDDGRTRDYMSGSYAVTTLSCRPTGEGSTLSISPPSGDRSAVPGRRSYVAKILAPSAREVVVRRGETAEVVPEGGLGWRREGDFIRVPMNGIEGEITLR